MRAMPFRIAKPSAVTFKDPTFQVNGEIFEATTPVTPWDYLSQATVTATATADIEELVTSTGLSSAEGVVALIQVDCPATGFRRTGSSPLQGDGRVIRLDVNIDPHEVAEFIEVTLSVILDRPDSPNAYDGVAFRRGSRLLTHNETYRFVLEGSASTFPTEAFDFEIAGLPKEAAWRLNFDPISFDEPYLGAVRLLINTRHHAAQEILSGKASLVQSVLFHGVVEQMLLTIAASDHDGIPVDFKEGSVGEAMDHLAQMYLDLSLGAAVNYLKHDRAEALCRLQARTGFLGVGRS